MPHATTRVDNLVTKNYPFGHPVNTVANNVCWNLAILNAPRARNLVSLYRAWVEIADHDEPGSYHPGCDVSACSTGARRATGNHFGRSSASGKGVRAANGCNSDLGISSLMRMVAENVGSGHKRNANSAKLSELVNVAVNPISVDRANRIQYSQIIMNTNRRSADKEKARSANSGPSRNSMSVVVVGTRSDSRQTA